MAEKLHPRWSPHVQGLATSVQPRCLWMRPMLLYLSLLSFPTCFYAISSRIPARISGNLYSKCVSLSRGTEPPFNMLTPCLSTPNVGVNSDTMTPPALSHSLLTYRPPPNLSVCASTRIQSLVFPPGCAHGSFPKKHGVVKKLQKFKNNQKKKIGW